MHESTEADFLAGLRVLTPFFEERDFALRIHPTHHDDEGEHFFARFAWGNHLVTIRHARSLEAVTYSIGSMSMEHDAYLEALAVTLGSAFSASIDDPIGAYQALLGDLETHITPFFECPDREFFELAMLHGRRGLPWVPEG